MLPPEGLTKKSSPFAFNPRCFTTAPRGMPLQVPAAIFIITARDSILREGIVPQVLFQITVQLQPNVNSKSSKQKTTEY